MITIQLQLSLNQRQLYQQPPTEKWRHRQLHPLTIPQGVRRSGRARTQTTAYVPTMKGKSYQYAALQLAESEWDADVVAMVFTQLTLKAALKTWGNDARAAAKSEMKQLHWRNSFKPVRLRDLTERQKQTILESHIIMKQKRTGEIKGQNSRRWQQAEGIHR